MDGITPTEFKALTQSLGDGAPMDVTFMAPMTMKVTADNGWFKSNCFTCENGSKFQAEVGEDGVMYARDKESGYRSRIIDVDAFRAATGDAQDYDFGAPVVSAEFKACGVAHKEKEAPFRGDPRPPGPPPPKHPGDLDGYLYAVVTMMPGEAHPFVSLVTRYKKIAIDAAEYEYEQGQYFHRQRGRPIPESVVVKRITFDQHGWINELPAIHNARNEGGYILIEEDIGINHFMQKYGLHGNVRYNQNVPPPWPRDDGGCPSIYAVISATDDYAFVEPGALKAHFFSMDVASALRHSAEHADSYVVKVCDGEYMPDGLANGVQINPQDFMELPDENLSGNNREAAAARTFGEFNAEVTEESHPSIGDMAGKAASAVMNHPKAQQLGDKLMNKAFTTALNLLSRTSNPAALAVIRGEQ
jgi:hypothetical protein